MKTPVKEKTSTEKDNCITVNELARGTQKKSVLSNDWKKKIIVFGLKDDR